MNVLYKICFMKFSLKLPGISAWHRLRWRLRAGVPAGVAVTVPEGHPPLRAVTSKFACVVLFCKNDFCHQTLLIWLRASMLRCTS